MNDQPQSTPLFYKSRIFRSINRYFDALLLPSIKYKREHSLFSLPQGTNISVVFLCKKHYITFREKLVLIQERRIKNITIKP